MEETDNQTDELNEELDVIDEETRQIIMRKPVNKETGFELDNKTKTKEKGRKKREKSEEGVIEFEVKKSGKKRCFNPRDLPLNWGKKDITTDSKSELPSLIREPIKINRPLAEKMWSKIL